MSRLRNRTSSLKRIDGPRFLAVLATLWLVPSASLADNLLPPGDFSVNVPGGWVSDATLSHEAAEGLPPGSARLDGESMGSALLFSPCIDLSLVPAGTQLVVTADLQAVNYDVMTMPVGALIQIRFYDDPGCNLDWTSYSAFLGALTQGVWTPVTAGNPYSVTQRYARAVVGVSQQTPAGGVTLIDNVELDAVGVSIDAVDVPATSGAGSLLLVLLLGAAATLFLRARAA